MSSFSISKLTGQGWSKYLGGKKTATRPTVPSQRTTQPANTGFAYTHGNAGLGDHGDYYTPPTRTNSATSYRRAAGGLDWMTKAAVHISAKPHPEASLETFDQHVRETDALLQRRPFPNMPGEEALLHHRILLNSDRKNRWSLETAMELSQPASRSHLPLHENLKELNQRIIAVSRLLEKSPGQPVTSATRLEMPGYDDLRSLRTQLIREHRGAWVDTHNNLIDPQRSTGGTVLQRYDQQIKNIETLLAHNAGATRAEITNLSKCLTQRRSKRESVKRQVELMAQKAAAARLSQPIAPGQTLECGIYRETQDPNTQRCGMHALNTILHRFDKQLFTPSEMDSHLNHRDVYVDTQGLTESKDLEDLATRRGLSSHLFVRSSGDSAELADAKAMLVLRSGHWVALVKDKKGDWRVVDSRDDQKHNQSYGREPNIALSTLVSEFETTGRHGSSLEGVLLLKDPKRST